MTDPQLLELQPIGVKIDNSPLARPQSGLGDACVVFEHLTEGDITRFTALFQTENPASIGPVRSGRLVDTGLASEFHHIFVHFGASPPVMARIQQSISTNLDFYFENSGYQRTSSRPAPYNAYTSMSALRDLAGTRGWEKPVEVQAYPFSGEIRADAGPAAKVVVIPYPSPSLVEYRYDEGRHEYLRFADGRPHVDAGTGNQISVSTIVVQTVPQWTTDIIEDSVGSHSLDIQLTGQGEATVFRDGVAIPATWVRKAATDRTRFLDASGNPIAFRPGSIWISLVPADIRVRYSEESSGSP